MSHHYEAAREALTPKASKPPKKSRKLPTPPRETDIVRSILDGLHACRILAWRVNTGAMVWPGHHNGKSRFIRFGPKGQADIQGILSPSGRFLALEVKRSRGIATPDQLDWLQRVRDAGGVASVVRSWTEVEELLRNVSR